MKEMETKYFPKYPGAITSGTGGGYVVVVSEKEIECDQDTRKVLSMKKGRRTGKLLETDL